MKMKRFISAIAALTMSVSCFAGLTITANAATGDSTEFVNVDFTAAKYNLTATSTVGEVSTATGLTLGGTATNTALTADKWVQLYSANTSSVTATLTSEQIAAIGENDKVLVEFDIAFGNLSGRYVTQELKDEDGTTITKFKYSVYSGVSTTDGDNDLNMSKDNFYRANTPDITRYTHFAYTIDYALNTVSCVASSYKNTTSKDPVVDKYGPRTLSTDLKKFKTFYFETGYNNNTRYCYMNNVKISKIEGEAVQTADYTIKYVDEEGTEIKTSRTGNGQVGVAPTIQDSPDKQTIDVDSDRYFYKEDDASTKTISSEGDTVVTVTFYKAAKVDYTVKSMIGGEVYEELDTGNGTERDSVSVPYKRFILKDGIVYEAERGSTNYYKKDFSISKTSPQNETIAYTKAADTLIPAGSKVILCKEFEDADMLEKGFTENASTASRLSNAKGAHLDKDATVTITTLPKGTYKIFISTVGNGRQQDTFDVKVGSNEAWTITPAGYLKDDTETFTLAEEGAVTITRTAEDRTVSLDNIIIVRTDPDPELEEPEVLNSGFAEVSATGKVGTAPEFAELAEAKYAVKKLLKINVKYPIDNTIPTITINDSPISVEAANWESITEDDGSVSFYAIFAAADDNLLKEFGTVSITYGEGEDAPEVQYNFAATTPTP